MQYTFYFKRHDGTMNGATEKAVIEGSLIKDALQKWCKKCIEEDDTGIFFELEDADLDYFKKQKHFHAIHLQEGDYGIVLEGLECYQPGRNDYLLRLRAKRELLGLTVPDMTQMCGVAHYKDIECNRRKCSLDDYIRFENVLNDYENEDSE